MLCYKDRTFCASNGTCTNRTCDRWIDFGTDYDLPIMVSEMRGTSECIGYQQHPALTALELAIDSPARTEEVGV